VFAQSTGASIVAGATDIGSHCDECIITVTLPFSYDLYGTAHTTAWASSNGVLKFDNGTVVATNSCLPNIFILNSIMPYWDDLRTDGTGVGIFTSITGSAPNRIFNVEWRACINTGAPCTGATMNFEVRLFEGLDVFHIIYGTIAQTGGSATVGVEGPSIGRFTQFSCNTSSLSSNLRLVGSLTATCITPTNTPTHTLTRTVTDTSTPTVTSTITNTPTNSATNTRTNTPTITRTPTLTPTPTIGCAPGGLYNVLIVYADPDNSPSIPTLQNQLLAQPNIGTVDIFSASAGTPSLALLLQYDEVIAYTGSVGWNNPVAMGNVLADYQDAGGAVVVMTFSYQTGALTLQGRWMTGGYTPFNTSGTTDINPRTLGTFDASSPLMQGVTTLDATYKLVITLTSGATQVAAYNTGNPLLAIKTVGGHVGVGINAYAHSSTSGDFSGDWGRLLANIARTIAPCPNTVTPTVTLTRTPTRTPTVTPTLTCIPGTDYVVTTGGASRVAGTVDTGNHCDNCTTNIALPFTYQLYGASFTTANVSSNGILEFGGTNTSGSNACLPDASFTNTIFGFWDDLRTDGTGVGVFTSTSGSAPNRIFNIEWRACINTGAACGSALTNFEIRLYEGQTRFDIHFTTLENTGTTATAGVEGPSIARYTQYICDTGSLFNNLLLTFTIPACQPTPSATPTSTRTHTPTSTLTPTFTGTSTPTITPPAATPVLVGHVNWQGRPAQPNTLQQLPITLTLKLGTTEINYSAQTTTASGNFTVSVGGLPNGTYDWRVKDPKYLANAGTVVLTGSAVTNQEMGLMHAADADNNNLVNILDFNIVKVTFGKGLGDPGYDDRADFDGNTLIQVPDFNLLKQNFGTGGAPPIGPHIR
jgi:hypothetical protein